MKKKLLFILILVISLFMVCCKTKSESIKGDIHSYSPSSRYKESTGISAPEIYSEGIRDDEYYSKPSYEEPKGYEEEYSYEGEYNGKTPQSHQLTSSACFDNDNFDYWKTLLSKGQEGAGTFFEYYGKYAFKTYNRVKVSLEGIPGAKVVLDNEFSGVTDANGIVYLFNKEYKESHNVSISYIDKDSNTVNFEKSFEGNELILSKDELTESKEKSKKIELMFVIDTTGSMGDEIEYLKVEIENVIQKVKDTNEDVTIYLALLFYRDKGDEYVTRYFDFTTDIEAQKENISKQSADGGGDFPEDINGAFNLANKQQWSTDSTTRIIVHVADAPDHYEYIDKWNNEVLEFAKKGIRIITVASSGIDLETEYFYRSECLLTNGCYGYLTDDSGIGYGHIEATTEEKLAVEYLDSMLVRLINGFYTGKFEEPVIYKGQN